MSNFATEGTVKIYTNRTITSPVDFISDWLDIQALEGFSYQIIWSGGGNITGTCELQSSLDTLSWVPVNASSQAISGASGSHIYDCSFFHYRYLRLVISLSSNSSTFNIWFNSRSRKN